MKVTRSIMKIILYCAIILIFLEKGDIVYAATYTVVDFTYTTDGSATKIESVAADSDFLNFECVTTYASGRTTKEKFSSFLINSSAYYTIPGLRQTNVMGKDCDTMVPQSICAVDDLVVIGAYDSDKECNSVIYVMSKTGALLSTVVMPNKSHMGALAYDGKTLWVGDTENDRMIGYTYSDIQGTIYYTKASKAKSVKMNVSDCDIIKLKTNPSFATYYDGVLWVGLFVKPSEDKTPYVYGYKLVYSENQFVTYSTKYEMEAPLETQGMTFYKHPTNNKLYLAISQSYGRNNKSKVIIYKPDDINTAPFKNGYYQVYKNSRTKDITMPNMSQGICWDSANMLTLFESAATLYSEGKDISNVITDCFSRLNINKICTY